MNEHEQRWKETEKNWRFLFLACAVYGAMKLLGGLGINILYWILAMKTFYHSSETATIGIIGGADGPTAIFLTTPVWSSYLVAAIMLVIGILGYLRLKNEE